MALKSSIECLTVHYKLGTRPRAFISSTRTPHESVAANADLISTSTSDVELTKVQRYTPPRELSLENPQTSINSTARTGALQAGVAGNQGYFPQADSAACYQPRISFQI